MLEVEEEIKDLTRLRELLPTEGELRFKGQRPPQSRC